MPRTALAFAPAVISNFFVIHDEAMLSRPIDLQRVGATGGGFTLSKGVYTRASVEENQPAAVSVSMNGDASYRATTARKAVSLLLKAAKRVRTRVDLEQRVQVPIGAGFGSSSASALSAAMAVASALDLGMDKAQVASFAHQADILCGTGLGTVSSTYDHVGAGIITHAGGPGVAVVERVKVPSDSRVVTATLSTMRGKGALLSSPGLKRNLNELGQEALEQALASRSFEGLLAAGETFAEKLGLEAPGIGRLISAAKTSGATAASQNMVGNSMHAVVHKEGVERLLDSLGSFSGAARLDVFRIGGGSARLVKPGKGRIIDT
ncbi:MAG: hypothetical protein OK455_11255 [Thaumarchaeota archaeon]|nr:hypothetical protein [Nitrososphaerota archaeon]